VDDARTLARAFFALPEAEKATVAKPRPDLVRGWLGLEQAAAAYSRGEETPPDLRETLAMGPLEVPDDPYFHSAEAGGHFAPNLWPARPAPLRLCWSELFVRFDALARQLMAAMALALALPEDTFEPSIDRAISMMEGIHYPAPVQPPRPGQYRIGPHTDHGSITFVSNEVVPGALEVAADNGSWIGVPHVPDSFVVNLGDLLARWTNDRWRSTLHRVPLPPADAWEGSDRLTIAFFHQPNYDAVIDCLPSCQDAEHPPRYVPVTSGAHLRAKYTAGTTFGKDTAGYAPAG
jgi:isopenicillin N synthase-like dioxygenase